MAIEINKGKIAGILGVILLGAIGSAAWDGSKQLLLFLGHALFDLGSLGLESALDLVYSNIALGHQERAAALGDFVVTIVIMSLWGGLMGVMMSLHRVVAGKPPLPLRLMTFLMREKKTVAKIEKSEEDGQRERGRRSIDRVALTKLFKWNMVITGALTAYMVGDILVRSAIVEYEDRAVAHFEQSLTICRPFLPPGDEVKLTSEFAQIRKRVDYVNALKKLGDVAHEHKVPLRSFSPW